MARRGPDGRPDVVTEHDLLIVESVAFAALVARMRALGISSLRIGECEVKLKANFNGAGLVADSSPDFSGASPAPLMDPTQHSASDDDLLFWAVGGSEVRGARPDFSDSQYSDDDE